MGIFILKASNLVILFFMLYRFIFLMVLKKSIFFIYLQTSPSNYDIHTLEKKDILKFYKLCVPFTTRIPYLLLCVNHCSNLIIIYTLQIAVINKQRTLYSIIIVFYGQRARCYSCCTLFWIQ